MCSGEACIRVIRFTALTYHPLLGSHLENPPGLNSISSYLQGELLARLYDTEMMEAPGIIHDVHEWRKIGVSTGGKEKKKTKWRYDKFYGRRKNEESPITRHVNQILILSINCLEVAHQ